jgi:hypothetical protein
MLDENHLPAKFYFDDEAVIIALDIEDDERCNIIRAWIRLTQLRQILPRRLVSDFVPGIQRSFSIRVFLCGFDKSLATYYVHAGAVNVCLEYSQFANLSSSRCLANKTRKCYHARMDEGRKRVLGIIAGILVARHLKTTEDLFDNRSSPRTEAMVASAVQWAERIMRKIDSQSSGR